MNRIDSVRDVAYGALAKGSGKDSEVRLVMFRSSWGGIGNVLVIMY